MRGLGEVEACSVGRAFQPVLARAVTSRRKFSGLISALFSRQDGLEWPVLRIGNGAAWGGLWPVLQLRHHPIHALPQASRGATRAARVALRRAIYG